MVGCDARPGNPPDRTVRGDRRPRDPFRWPPRGGAETADRCRADLPGRGQVLLGARSEHHWLRMCCGRLGRLFPVPAAPARLSQAAQGRGAAAGRGAGSPGPPVPVLARPGPADRCDPGAVRHLAKAHGIACVRLVDNAWTYITRHTTATTPPVLTGAYSGYAMTPDGDGDYDFTLLTSSSDNTRSALITPA
jgi:hypothetical protein